MKPVRISKLPILGVALLVGCTSDGGEGRLTTLTREVRSLERQMRSLGREVRSLKEQMKSMGPEALAARGTVAARAAAGSGRRTVAAKPTSGSMSRQVIQRVVDAHMGRVRKCYDVALEADSGAQGELTYVWVINTDGKVGSAKIVRADGTIKSSGAASCILSVVKTMSFPAPERGPVQVRYPFKFKLKPPRTPT